jgi:hypothetical protein
LSSLPRRGEDPEVSVFWFKKNRNEKPLDPRAFGPRMTGVLLRAARSGC